jgi:hypothetical protein
LAGNYGDYGGPEAAILSFFGGQWRGSSGIQEANSSWGDGQRGIMLAPTWRCYVLAGGSGGLHGDYAGREVAIRSLYGKIRGSALALRWRFSVWAVDYGVYLVTLGWRFKFFIQDYKEYVAS